jgi:SEC-C motif
MCLHSRVVITHLEKERPQRNDPCHCGSGRKYKQCCIEADERAASAERRRAASVRQLSYEKASPAILALKKETELRQRAIREYLARDFGVLINIVAPVDFGDRKVWAIGNRVYTDCPPKQTFHEFILGLLRQTLGREWAEAQAALPSSEQHHLYCCMLDYAAWTERVAREEKRGPDGLWSAAPSGSAQYLISVAWDLAVLLQASSGPLPARLPERLRDARAFQGARYELAIAGLFAKLDCAIEFLDDGKQSDKKHGEFIATHRPSGQRFAVEAKSRHREGVINQPGEFNAEEPLRGDRRGVRRLLRDAMEKDPGGLPLLVFLDINTPVEDPVPGVEPKWQSEIQALAGRMPQITGDERPPFDALYVTNFSPHYDGSEIARGGELLCLRALDAAAAVPSELIEQANYALDRSGRVPEIGVGGEVR